MILKYRIVADKSRCCCRHENEGFIFAVPCLRNGIFSDILSEKVENSRRNLLGLVLCDLWEGQSNRYRGLAKPDGVKLSNLLVDDPGLLWRTFINASPVSSESGGKKRCLQWAVAHPRIPALIPWISFKDSSRWILLLGYCIHNISWFFISTFHLYDKT